MSIIFLVLVLFWPIVLVLLFDFLLGLFSHLKSLKGFFTWLAIHVILLYPAQIYSGHNLSCVDSLGGTCPFEPVELFNPQPQIISLLTIMTILGIFLYYAGVMVRHLKKR